MKKLLVLPVLSFFTFNSVNANFNLYDWNPENLKNFQSKFDWTPNKVDNVIYTYNFNEKNFKILNSEITISYWPGSPELVYKNEIFDKNDKKLSKELKTWKRNLEIKYEFVKKEGKYFYRPFVELDLDLSKESKNDDFVELKFSYERFNYWAY